MREAESLKERILRKILELAKNRQKINRKAPLIFTIKQIHDSMPEEYGPSIGRDLRSLRMLGLLNCEIVGRKIDGKYRLVIDGRNTKEAVVEEIEKNLNILRLSRKPRNNEVIDNILRIKRGGND